MQQLKQHGGKFLQLVDNPAGIRQNIVDAIIQYSQPVDFQTDFVRHFECLFRGGHIRGLPIRQDEQHFSPFFSE